MTEDTLEIPIKRKETVLSHTAILAKLKISLWTGSKKDKNVTQDTLTRNNANGEAGNFTKKLMAKKYIANIQKAASAIRKFHFEMTLPWEDDGARLLVIKLYKKYTNGMRDLKDEFEVAKSDLIDRYQEILDNAPAELGDLFDLSEFPSPEELDDKYKVTTDMDPIQNSSNFWVEMADAERDKIKADLEARIDKRQEKAMKDVWDQLYKIIERMAQYTNPDSKIYDTHFKTLENLVEVLPSLNLTGDEKLTEMTTLIKDQMYGYEASALRKNKALKAEVGKRATSVLDKFPGADTSKPEDEEVTNA